MFNSAGLSPIEPKIGDKHIKELMINRYYELESKNIFKIHPSMDKPADSSNDQEQLTKTVSSNKKLKPNVKKFYKNQKKILVSFFEAENIFRQYSLQYNGSADSLIQKEHDSLLPTLPKKPSKVKEKKFKFSSLLIQLSLAVNICLLVAKVVASVFSNSVSIISSTIDSSIDILSSLIGFWVNRSMQKYNVYKNPQGRHRLEPIGILIMACVMSVASFQVITEALKRIISGDDLVPTFSLVSLIIIGVTIGSKLILFLMCLRTKSDTVKALKQDHLNDVLSNTIALIGFVVSAKYWPYTDTIFAIVISLYIIINWTITGKSNVSKLTGKTASPETIQKLTYICLNHNDNIIAIDTVRAYTFGTRYLVEIDIVLPENMELCVAHNIGESLQRKLEFLPEVERAFVHIDYEFEHHPKDEHRLPMF